jgi:DNA-directed RNA polymerase specialized sigma24 family protein
LSGAEFLKDGFGDSIGGSDSRKALIKQHEKLLFGFILSFAPFSREQAFQMAVSSFIEVFKEARLDPENGAFLEGLFRTALKKFEGVVPSGAAGFSAFGAPASSKKEALKIVREGLFHLTPEDKAVILLRDQCHFSFERIAAILKTRPQQARSSCLVARERLREVVKNLLEGRAG